MINNSKNKNFSEYKHLIIAFETTVQEALLFYQASSVNINVRPQLAIGDISRLSLNKIKTLS